MAETFSAEGLDYVMSVLPKGGTAPSQLFCGLWTTGSSGPTTVPAFTCVLSTYTSVGEASFTSYARQAIASGSWGAMAAGSGAATGGRQTTGPQCTFPAAGAAYATPINGVVITNLATHGSEVGIFYANFDDLTAVVSMAIGDVIKATPTYGMTP